MQCTLVWYHICMCTNVEAYIDDIMAESRHGNTLVQDLEEMFRNLRKIKLKLNPEKCLFGVPSGKLLGFLVSHRGIEANPNKIEEIERIGAPIGVKDVHCLKGYITALQTFISKLGKRALPFFKLLTKSGSFQWTPEEEVVLQDLKTYLASPPVLMALNPGEPLLLYVVAMTQVVSVVLFAAREDTGAEYKKPGDTDHAPIPDKEP